MRRRGRLEERLIGACGFTPWGAKWVCEPRRGVGLPTAKDPRERHWKRFTRVEPYLCGHLKKKKNPVGGEAAVHLVPSKMELEATSRYTSPVNPAVFPHLTVVLLAIGMFFTAWFFVYPSAEWRVGQNY